MQSLSSGPTMARMGAFWKRNGLSSKLATKLAQRSAKHPLWANENELKPRIDALKETLPYVSLDSLLHKAPGLITYKPETIQCKIKAISRAFPKVDVARLLTSAPNLLQRDMKKIAERAEVLQCLGRSDLASAVCAQPGIFTGEVTHLRDRLAIVRRAFSPRELAQMRVERLARLLCVPSEKLRRLLYVRSIYPEKLSARGDNFVLNLKPEKFEKKFKPRRMTPFVFQKAQKAFPKIPRYPLMVEDVHKERNPFTLGRKISGLWRAALEQEQPRVTDTLSKHIEDPRARFRAPRRGPLSWQKKLSFDEVIAQRLEQAPPRGDLLSCIVTEPRRNPGESEHS